MTPTTNQPISVRNERKALRAIGALTALVAIVIGVPFGLAQWGHWPISGIPSVEDVQDGWTRAVSDTTVFGLLTLTAWVIWALFLLSVVVEAQAEIAQRRAGRVPLAGPVQRSARYLVVSLLLWISSLSANAGKGGDALPEDFAVEAVAPDAAAYGGPDALISSSPSPTIPTSGPQPGPVVEPADSVVPGQVTPGPDGSRWGPETPASPGSPGAPGAPDRDAGGVGQEDEGDEAAGADEGTQRLPETVTVRPHDTAWGIAEQLWGDGLRWTELWEVNQGRVQPDGRCWEDPELIHPGWEFEVPGAEQVPAPQADADDGSVPTAPEVPEPVTHTVVPGDTLWEIAEEHLGDPTAYPEIFERNQGVQEDGRTFDDPDLIHPGWVLEVSDAAAGTGGTGGDDPFDVPAPPDISGDGTGGAEDDGYEVEPQVAVSVSIEDLRPGEGGGSDDAAPSATPYSAGGHMYLVGDGVVRYVDSATYTQINAIALPGRVVATIDADGILWTLTPRDGVLRQIVDGEIVAETPLVDPGHDVAMTLSGNRPVVLDTTVDELWLIDRRTASAGDDPLSAPSGAVLQASSVDGTRVWMTEGQTLVGIRADGDRIEIPLNGAPDGPPDVSGDQVELVLTDGTELTFADYDGELLTERVPDD